MTRPRDEADSSNAARGALLCAAAIVLTFLLVASRRPDAFTNPQFWAEDAIWYADAHNQGALTALFSPWMGYVEIFARLAAALSLAVDLTHAPLVVNLMAAVCQSIPPIFVLLRCSGQIPNTLLRVLCALLLVGLPNAFEVQINSTNGLSHLALLAFLIVFADAPAGWIGQGVDFALLLLAGLSGPHCVLLVPFAIVAWLHCRDRRHVMIVAVLLVTTAVQLTAYATSPGARFDTPLGASVARFLQIVGGQVFFAGAVGAGRYAALMTRGEPWWSFVTAGIGAVGLAFVARACLKTSSFALRMLVLFAASVLAAALVSPVTDRVPRWEALRIPGSGIRYYFLPIVAYLAVVVWSAFAERNLVLRWGARGLLALVLFVGLPSDWRAGPWEDFAFPTHATRFDAAPAGERVTIPIPPRGWFMELRKGPQ